MEIYRSIAAQSFMVIVSPIPLFPEAETHGSSDSEVRQDFEYSVFPSTRYELTSIDSVGNGIIFSLQKHLQLHI